MNGKTPTPSHRNDVLLVDDDKDALFAVQKALKRRARVVAVSNANDAMLALRLSRFDAIITDYKMPRCDGVRLLRRVRAWFPDVLRVLISGYYVDEISELLRAGVVQRYVNKPLALEELLSSIGLPGKPPAPGETVSANRRT